MSQSRRSVVFIDANITDLSHLISGIKPGVAVSVLTDDANGVDQITAYLSEHPADIVHIVSHGAPGMLQLGNGELSLDNLGLYASALSTWFAQSENASLLLYGCNVAAGDAGEELIQKLQHLVGANISASTTVTGHASQGGNWVLDFSTANVSAPLAFTEAVETWPGALANVTINPTGGVNSTGSDGLKIVVEDNARFQIYYRNNNQVFGSVPGDSSVSVAVGGVTYGGFEGNRQWSLLGQSGVTGTGTQSSPFTVVTSVYADLNSNGTYDASSDLKLDYTVSYIANNLFFAQSYALGIPSTNTQPIKLYHFMDTYLLGGDAGPAYGLDSAGNPITGTASNPAVIGTAKNLGTSSESFLAFVESGREWDRWFSGGYDTPYSATDNGGDLPITYNTNASTDNGIAVQYNLGAATGNVTVRNILTFDVNAAFDIVNNTAPTVTGGNQTLSYAVNGGAVDFGPIVVSDSDSTDTITANYRLSSASAGSLSSTGGGSYNATTGVWSVSGTAATVNAALDALRFTPASGFSQNITITGQISDGTDIIDSTITMNVNANSAPSGTVTISGTPTQGQTLTATNTLTDADGLGAITYTWFSGGVSTGKTGATYALGQSDVGKVITVRASYTDGSGKAEAVTSSGTSAIANANIAPSGTVTISGTATQGQTLSASNNLADADGLGAITYTWFADGIDTGKTGATYALGQSDVGKVITVRASYTDGDGKVEAVTSSGTSAIANANIAPSGTVTISGTATQGQTLSASNNLADADGLGTITYTWFADGIDTGKTGATYALGQSDVGKVVTVRASYTDGDGKTETVTSSGTSAVSNTNDSPTGTVTISGTATQGQTLTASNTLADLDGLGAITYTWFADGTSTGRTGATYLLGQADVGKIFTVVASYTDSGTTAESVTSAPTASIAPAVTVSGLDSFTFTEGSGPIIIDNNVSFTSFVNYNDGSLRFKLTNGTTADQLGLTSSATPNAVGAISIDGSDVYLGNGTGRDRIGSIDATLDGTNGKDLLINFASPLTNSGFETGNLTGWTAFNQNYSTINNLNGQSIPYVFANGTITGTGTIILGSSPSVTFSSQVQTTTVSSGTYALRLFSNGGISGPSGSDRPTGNGSVHGSYVRSSTFNAFAGDSITLDWAAQNGSDAYEVFGFLVGAGGDNTFGTGDDTRTRLFAQRGDVQAFTEASAVISSTGAYQFEFVCGTYDKTGGLALGASLYVDNVRLVSSTSVTSAVVSTIAQQVTYNNTSTAPITTPRTLEVTATNANGESGSATSSGTVVGVNNSPTGDVTISGTAAQGQTLTAANTLVDGDGLGAITYTWFADGIDTGKTGTTYTLGQADVGKVFTVRASYTDNGGTNEAVTSVGTSAVTDENVAPTGGVTISGTVAQGQTLTASNTLADADGLGELSYEWEQSLDGNTWTTISGATASTFTLTQDQVNQFVRAKVSYTDGDGNAESVASTATTNKVTNENDAPTGAVTVNGVLKEGYVLTADTSTLADLDGLGALSYQWERSSDGGTTWTTIPEATDSSFTLGKSEVGQTLRVKVSYTDNLGGLEQLTSAATAESVAVFKPNSDFDGDGYADIFWRNTALESAVVWLMQDINPQGAVSILPNIDGGWEIRAVADFDGNGGPDVLWQNSLSSETVFWLFDGLTPTTAVNLFEPGLAWEVADAGDFNGDGKADIIWRNVVTGENALWFMDGTQAIGAGSLPTIPDTEWEISAVGDLSRDGKTDIIWRHGLDGDTVVWTMDGATPVEAITIAEVPTNWALHGAVSLSGDTQLDLLWHNQDSGEVVMWDMKGLDVNGAVSLAFVPSNWEATL